MKPIWIVILLVLLAGNLIGGYLAYKAFRLRAENQMLNKYLANLTEKNRELSTDYPGISTYAEDNRRLLETTTTEERRQMCVFYGASITKGIEVDSFLPEFKIVNRGVGGQSGTQLLARFSSDVLQLEPGRVVVKICAGNFSPTADSRMIWDEFETMLLAAQSRGIEPIVATMVPVTRRAEEHEGYSVTEQVRQFNARATEFARAHGFKLVDYFTATADREGFLPDDMARDAIHPNARGYVKMVDAFRAAMR